MPVIVKGVAATGVEGTQLGPLPLSHPGPPSPLSHPGTPFSSLTRGTPSSLSQGSLLLSQPGPPSPLCQGTPFSSLSRGALSHAQNTRTISGPWPGHSPAMQRCMILGQVHTGEGRRGDVSGTMARDKA